MQVSHADNMSWISLTDNRVHIEKTRFMRDFEKASGLLKYKWIFESLLVNDGFLKRFVSIENGSSENQIDSLAAFEGLSEIKMYFTAYRYPL